MRILIVYDSRTGNTKKEALEIAKGVREIEHVEYIIKSAQEATMEDLRKSHGLVIGCPTYYGSMSGSLKTFFDKTNSIHGKLEGKVGAAFTSSDSTATGAETTILSILEAMLVHGMIIQGDPNDKHYGMAVVKALNKREALLCRRFGHRVAELTKRLAK